MDNRDYYLGITKGNKILETNSLDDFLIRNDIAHIFKATFLKNTPKNVFFKISYLKEREIQEPPVVIEINGFKTIYNGGEFWGEFFKNVQGKCIQFKITDLIGREKKVNFHNSPKRFSAFENLIKYLDDLSRLGTHQAIFELQELVYKLNKLKQKHQKH